MEESYNDMKKITTILAAILLTTIIAGQHFEPVPYDKKWHIAAGTVAGVWGTFAGNNLQLTPEQSALCGIAAATIAGIGKELIDIAPAVFGNDARFDMMDIAATIEGGVIGAGLSYVALKIFKKKPVIYGYVDKGLIIGTKINF